MSRLLLLSVLLLVPLAGLFASLHVGAALEYRWQELLGRAGEMFGPDTPSLAIMCGMDARLDGTVLCQRQAAVVELRGLAGAALLGAVALPSLLLTWAGLVRLVRAPLLLFRALARLLPPLLLLLLAVEGAVLTLALVLVETALYGREVPLAGIVGGFCAGALLLMCVVPCLRLMQVSPRFVLAHRAEPDRHPRLRELVGELAGRLDAEPPLTVLLGLAPGVWVSGERLHVHPAEAVITGPVLYVSVALLRAVTPQEFSALLAHELSLLEVRQRRATLRAWPAMSDLERRLHLRVPGWRGLAAWPAATLLEMHLDLARAAAWRHALRRERDADAAGAAITSPAVMAMALLRLTAAQCEWHEQDADLVRAVLEERRARNLLRVFRRRLELLPSRPWLDELARERTEHPLYTHTPLQERIEILGAGRDVFSHMALLPSGASAIELLQDAERLEESLSDAQYLLYRARGYTPAPE